MGGELSVASDPGTGSTFTLTLPAYASGPDHEGVPRVNASAVRVV